MNRKENNKEKKLEISIVNFSDLSEELRLDSEYYSSEYLTLDKQINNKEFSYLEDIAMVKGGKRLPRGENFCSGGVPYIRAEDIKHDFIDYGNSPKISIRLFERLKRYRVKFNDVILTIVGNSIGDIGIIKFNLDKCILTENCAKIITSKEIMQDFLFIFLKSKYGQYQIKREKVGTSQPKLALARISKIKVPKVSPKFQNKIYSFIEEAERLNKESKLSYQEAQILLFQELEFTDIDYNEKIASIHSLKDCSKNNRIDADYWQSKYDRIVNKIQCYENGHDSLENLFEISRKKIQIDPNKQYNYIELADIDPSTGIISDGLLINGKDLPSRARMKLENDSIILSSVEGSLNKIALVKTKSTNLVGSTGFFVFKEKYYKPEVALILLQSYLVNQQFRREAQGTILSAIPATSLKKIILPKLNSRLQAKIGEKVQLSHLLIDQSKQLLEKAQRAVEIIIEQDESAAINFMQDNDL